MSDDNHQESPRVAPGSGQNDDEPARPPSQPNQGLRKRTSILVGLAFVLFGLLMLFIAGDSAASIAPAQCSGSVLHADTSLGTGYFVTVPW